jgi:hypothetical protein
MSSPLGSATWFQLGLGDQRAGARVADDACDGERRAFVDGVDGVPLPVLSATSTRRGGVLGDRGAALCEVDFDVEVFAAKPLARRDVTTKAAPGHAGVPPTICPRRQAARKVPSDEAENDASWVSCEPGADFNRIFVTR